MQKKKLYIGSQLVGWALYITLAFFLTQIAGVPINKELLFSLLVAFILGLILSHAYREIILRNNWLGLNIVKIIPRFVFGSILMASLFELFYVGITHVFLGHVLERSLMVQEIASLIILFVLWSLIYFFYHFFRNYKTEEIKNLKWEALKNEIELNKLKSQLNPHFMFNSMNTIRALIDENPKIAKLAVTQFSNILRSNLLMGRQKLIPLEQEIKLVKDYLAVESYRYEERLNYTLNISPKTNGIMVPPLMIQTLVENGIKHGISKIPSGGEIKVTTTIEDNEVKIQILNSGQFIKEHLPTTGFGLANTRERLKILYGNKAKMTIDNFNNSKVITEIHIPKSLENEVKNNIS